MIVKQTKQTENWIDFELKQNKQNNKTKMNENENEREKESREERRTKTIIECEHIFTMGEGKSEKTNSS